jgi:hypothetical protein
MQLSLLSAGLVLASALSAPLQEDSAVVTSSEPDLGGPLVVGGVEIPQIEIRRFLIYGPCRSTLEYHRLNAIIDDQIERRVNGYEDELSTWQAITDAGADAGPEPRKWTPEDYVVTDEEFQTQYEKKIKKFKEKYPEMPVETEICRAYRSLSWYERELQQEMRFDLTFIPDNQDDWPALTFEALREEADDILINDFRSSYERRVKDVEERMAAWQAKVDAGDEEAGPEPTMYPEDSMYRSVLRQIVRDMVFKVIDTKTKVHGLPEDLICTMDFNFDGTPEYTWTTADLWEQVKGTVTEVEVREARQLLALLEATRQRLVAEKKMMSDEAVETLMEEITASFQSSMFDLATIAVGSHMFPSVEAYATYLPLLKSYETSVQPLVATPEEGGLPAVLRAHLNQANNVMGLGKVDCEVLLISAFDFPGYRWKENGWEAAKAQAEQLKVAIEQNQAEFAEYRKARMDANSRGENYKPEKPILEPHDFWSQLVTDYCEFWDPPPPSKGRQSAVTYKQKGRFGERTRNDLRSFLSESPYSHFLNGHLLVDQLFFDQPIGTVAGPIRMKWGYCLTKVLRRTPPTRPLNINDERHVELLRDDWIKDSFVDYAHEALDSAEKVGVPE